ncbi:hypothetical protein [Streptomyces sp. NPDC058620]
MSEDRASWHPGEIVPASGIYECDCGEGITEHGREGPPFPAAAL